MDENAAVAAPRSREEQLAEWRRSRAEAKLKASGGRPGGSARRPLQANVNSANVAPRTARPPDAKKAAATPAHAPRPAIPAGPQTAVQKRPQTRPVARPPGSATAVPSDYNLRSRTAPVHATKIRRDFSVYKSQSRSPDDKTPKTSAKHTPTPAARTARDSPPRDLVTLDELFSAGTAPAFPRLAGPPSDSPPKQDGAMLIEEIGSPAPRPGPVADGIFGPRRRSPKAASRLPASPSPRSPPASDALNELIAAHAARIAGLEAELGRLRAEKDGSDAARAAAEERAAELEAEVARLSEDLAAAAEASAAAAAAAAAAPAADPETLEALAAIRAELRDAYEVIDVLQAREDWISPDQAAAEEARLRAVIEDLDDRYMEMEIEKFKAQKDLVGERCRAEELQAALAEALAENEQLHERVRALESRTPLASDPDTPRSRAETAEADAQTDDHPWDRLFADANRAVLESKLLRFGNAAMYQQMLENNDEFRKAFEEVADELRQEKENNAVLMSMQEELMADLQNTYDGQAQEGEDGVQAEEDAHNGEDVPADAQGYETDDGRVAPPQELQDTPRPRFSP